MRKRLLVLVLALCMVLTLLPFGASAAEIVDSGMCSENIIWTLDSDGLLKISGSGAMENYSYGDSPFQENSDIRSVVIDEGVKTIGVNAFAGCTLLSSVTIPDSVEFVGPSAFSGCSKLLSVQFGDHLSSIGEYAFYKCDSVNEIVIPDSVKEIGRNAFYDCDGLQTVNLGNGDTKINDGAFENCDNIKELTIGSGTKYYGYLVFHCMNLKRVNLNDLNAYLSSRFYSYNSTAFAFISELYCDGQLVTDLMIPDGVQSIPSNSFAYCKTIKSVTIPECVTEIGEMAFDGSSDLNIVFIKGIGTCLENDSFKNCSGLSDVLFAGSADI